MAVATGTPFNWSDLLLLRRLQRPEKNYELQENASSPQGTGSTTSKSSSDGSPTTPSPAERTRTGCLGRVVRDVVKSGKPKQGPNGKPAPRNFQVNWIIKLAGSILALCAGCVNVISLFALGRFTSHVTGNVTRIAMFAKANDPFMTWDHVGLVASFMAGSMVCGLLIAKNTVHIGLALYGIVLMGNAVLLFAATMEAHQLYAHFLAAAACGLQNGIVTSYSGAVVRTTHVTGIATDIGLLAGRLLGIMIRRGCGYRRKFDVIDKADISQDLNKLQLLSILFFSYGFGAYFGSWLYEWLGLDAMLVPAGITGVAGFAYTCWRIFFLGQSLLSTEEMEGVEVTLTAGADVAVVGDITKQDTPKSIIWHGHADDPDASAIVNVFNRDESLILDRATVLERPLSVLPPA